MPTCKEVFTFLNQVSTKSVSMTLAPTDEALLTQLNFVQVFTPEQYRQLQSDVQGLGAAQQAVAQDQSQRAADIARAQEEDQKTHSFLFRLEGQEKQSAELQRQSQAHAALDAVDKELASRVQQFGSLIAKRSLLDTVTPYGERFVGLTGFGAVQLRDLGVRLYRVSDTDFGAYWTQTVRITQDLVDLAAHGADYFLRLGPSLPNAERSYLWAIGIGLSKVQPDANVGAAAFVQTYNQVAGLSNNLENRLMASEILTSLPRPLATALPTLTETLRSVGKIGVPPESALGVASILVLGQREDATIALPNLQQFLTLTRSYESAALLAILNVPTADLVAKFQSLRAMFGGWGYRPSEDTELASAYLSLSELPIQGMSTKLAIIAKGMQAYLQYPLVAAAILASVSTMEANETLNLLEKAYGIVGQRAMPMSQAELISLAVRMVHGIRNELVGQLDTTATAAPAAPQAGGYYYGPRFFFFAPIVIVHGAYFSTYSGIGGAHPGHVHGFGGGGGGGVG
jgi:hypothetical protein